MRQILLSDYYPDFYEDEFGTKEERKTKQRILIATIILIGVLLCSCLLYVQQRVKYAKLSYRINSLKKEEQIFKNKNALLQAEKEQLGSLQRIERIARRKLGLVMLEETIIPLQD